MDNLITISMPEYETPATPAVSVCSDDEETYLNKYLQEILINSSNSLCSSEQRSFVQKSHEYVSKQISENKKSSKTDFQIFQELESMRIKLRLKPWSAQPLKFSNSYHQSYYSRFARNLIPNDKTHRHLKTPKKASLLFLSGSPSNSDKHQFKSCPKKTTKLSNSHLRISPIRRGKIFQSSLYSLQPIKQIMNNSPIMSPSPEVDIPLRKYRPAPIISKFRGESPYRNLKKPPDSRLSSSLTTKSFFNDFNKPNYFIIHPEWLSETISIQRMGLEPRPTPIPISRSHQHLNKPQIKTDFRRQKSSFPNSNWPIDSRCNGNKLSIGPRKIATASERSKSVPITRPHSAISPKNQNWADKSDLSDGHEQIF